MTCPKCGSTMLAGQKFCGECGHRLEAARWLDLVPPQHVYTPTHLADKILRSRSAIEGERKLVTVLFCDIADSTPLAAQIGAERMHKLLNAFFEAALTEVHRYEGTINQFLGDGFMALFGAPVGHEDHARRAVLSALAIRRSIEADALRVGERPLRLRIGLNSGMVVVGKIGDNLRMDYTAIGDTTNVAARLQHVAEPGQILIGEHLLQAVDGYVECEALGPRLIKGKALPLPVYAILRPLAAVDVHRHRAAPAGSVTSVGRQAETGEIRQAIDRVKSGVGGSVRLVGEAGLGKSRMIEEARLHAKGQSLHWATGQCLSFGRTLSYWPFRQAIRGCFEIHETESELAGFDKLRAGIELLFGTSANELLPYIGALLALPLPRHLAERTQALDGLAMGHQISRATLRLFERLAAQAPLVLALDDWHWADASSADLLEHLLPLGDRVAMLFVVAYRPESHGAVESLHRWIATPERAALSREIVLMPLPPHECGQLADKLLGGGSLPAQVRNMLLRRSDGNPFYLGELVRALIASEGIERDSLTGDWQMTERYDAIPLPDTIEGVILARVDLLESELKQVLKTAAVIGRSFFYRVLKAIVEEPDRLDSGLVKLRGAELIDEKQPIPELEYMFKHPLIRQATYDSMVEDQRRLLHREVGACIERLFASGRDQFHSMLAYHFAKAEDWPKAQHYLLLAAEHADRLAADEEALELYNAVIVTAERHSAAGLDALTHAQLDAKIGEAQFRAGRHEEALRQFALALGRLGYRLPRTRLRLGMEVATGLCRLVSWRFVASSVAPSATPMTPAHRLCCEIWQYRTLIQFFTDPVYSVYDSLQIATLARRHPDSQAYVFSLSLIGMTFTALGFYRSAEWCLRRAAILGGMYGEQWLQAMVDHFRAMHHHHIGEWAIAADLAESAAERCWASGNIRLWSAVLCSRILYLYALGAPGWMDIAERLWSVVSETSDRQSQAWAMSAIAALQEHRGDHAEALATLQKAVDIYAAIPDLRMLAHALGARCKNLLELGRIDEAAECCERAMLLVSRHHLSGSLTTRLLLAAAELCLVQLEAAPAPRQRQARTQAAKAVRTLLRQGHRVRDEGAIESHRVAGTLAWLVGDLRGAQSHWQRGLAQAQLLGARHARARVLFERGRRLNQDTDLEEAEKLFAVCFASGEQRELAKHRARADGA